MDRERQPDALGLDPAEADYRERLQRALGADYELRDLIGRGGFGSVYGAWDKRLEREVAIKALRHDLFPTRQVLERFQREARAVAKLRHPHILPIYAVGEGDGLAFMIMPRIRGESLGAFFKRGGRLPMDEGIRVATEVARALDAAHRLGIIHRDVKPENIMLDGEGDERHALLADFGIAKVVETDGDMTGSGVVIGSPQYMSPEQAAAERDLDHRSDIYSLGAVAFEVLAGRRVYEAANYQQFLVQQFTTEPPQIAELVPQLPPAAAAAVMRALARDRAARWQSAGDFAAALASSTGREAVRAADGGESWFARRGLLLAVVLLLFLYVDVTAVVLMARARDDATMSFAVNVFRTPLHWVFKIGLALLLAELVFTVVSARKRGGTRAQVLRAAFGQPRWWQPWYPRVLRTPDSVWDRMPLTIKVMRTVTWLAIAAIPLALPLIFVVPGLALFAASANVALPLPLRATIRVSSALAMPMFAAALLVPAVAAVVARRRGVPIVTVLRLLFTWRADRWNSAEGQRLLV